MLDWLPWSHVFGANNVAVSSRNGWSFYLDAGRPTPGESGTTIANLIEVKPGFHNNVPLGYDMLLKEMRRNPDLAQAFYENMRLTFYAAAALPSSTWEGLQEMAVAVKGHPVPMVTQWGATETGPTATDSHFIDPRHLGSQRSGNIGIPVPGCELKLVRFGDKWEVRLRGPGIFPGYWKNPQATADAFDEEGFYKIGDAVRFADEMDPVDGLYFDGRISEDFKLASGTWVSVSNIRVRGIAALAPAVSDIVVTGHGRSSIGFLLVPDLKACRSLAGLPPETPAELVVARPELREHVRKGLAALKADGGGSSQYAARARFLVEPPSLARQEMTDKGYINQRAMLRNRSSEIEALHSDDAELWIGLD